MLYSPLIVYILGGDNLKSIVKIENMYKSFYGAMALNGMNFNMNEGEIRSLIGENGCGKSTMIKVISGFHPFDSGDMYINDKPYKKISPSESIAEGIQVIYQDFSLFPNMTIAENIMMYSTVAKGNAVIHWKEIRKKAEEKASSDTTKFAFEQALRAEGLSFICEAKKASPSKGLIAPDFPYVQIAQDYEAGGAAAISCLTEPFWFQGSDRYLEEIVQKVSIPVLRKDFTCDEYMIYQAKAMGAAAVLLICSCLDEGQLKAYHQLAEELGISALVETHSEEEILTADRIGAKIIGVNNRNLKDFTVDINNSIRLRELVDPKTVFVSESGIKGGEDMKALYKNGTDAVLIGELLMRAEDRKKKLAELRMETRKGC